VRKVWTDYRSRTAGNIERSVQTSYDTLFVEDDNGCLSVDKSAALAELKGELYTKLLITSVCLPARLPASTF